MPGGLLNLIANGNLNIILNGSPSKKLFNATYAKYTNFGLQKFRIEFKTLNTLRLSEDSLFEFEVPRYGDLMMDTYFSILLPDIWSPIYVGENLDTSFCQPYEFKWIENVGAQAIRTVRFMIDGRIIQEFTGQYLYSMVQRDFSAEKKELFNELIGNIPELNDPANYSNRNGNYPSASYAQENNSTWTEGLEPSIRSKRLYVPLNIWSTLSSKMALPIVSLHYNKLHIQVECRPIEDLIVVRDLDYFTNWVENHEPGIPPDYALYDCPYIRPDFNDPKYQMFFFLNEPPSGNITGNLLVGGLSGTPESRNHYSSVNGDWHSDIHLMSTFAFLSKDETRVFASQPQSYLIKEISEDIKYNVTGAQRQNINSEGLVSSWMWFFQRSDVNLRNQWSNYTNWEYNHLPYPGVSIFDLSNNPTPDIYIKPARPICPSTYKFSDKMLAGPIHIANRKNIMTDWGLLCDGIVRETILPEGLVNLVEKYVRTAGNAKDGLYCYNFCLNTNPFELQPSGAMNLSRFKNIDFEYTTILPFDVSGNSGPAIPTMCDEDGNIIGVYNPTWKDYEYSYNLHVMEERYNVLIFESGMARLMFSR